MPGGDSHFESADDAHDRRQVESVAVLEFIGWSQRRERITAALVGILLAVVMFQGFYVWRVAQDTNRVARETSELIEHNRLSEIARENRSRELLEEQRIQLRRLLGRHDRHVTREHDKQRFVIQREGDTIIIQPTPRPGPGRTPSPRRRR